MKKYNKLMILALVLIMSAASLLVSCVNTPDPVPQPPVPPPIIEPDVPEVPVTDSEKYAKIIAEHVVTNGYTLNIDSTTTVAPIGETVYAHIDVALLDGVVTKTTTIKKIPGIGEEAISETKLILENYIGEKLGVNLALANLAEGYSIKNINDVITVTGTVVDPVVVFGASAKDYSNVTITIIADVAKNKVISYTANFTQKSLVSVMEYKIK